MEFNFFKLLILLQLMFILTAVGYRPEGGQNIDLKSVKVVKENPFLSADNFFIYKGRMGRGSSDTFELATNINVKKDITPEDGLTISFVVSTYGIPPTIDGEGKNITFCMDDTSSDLNGSMVKIFRMAFSLQPEECPIEKGSRPTKTTTIVVYGLEVPRKHKYANVKIVVRLEAPELGEIAVVEAMY